MMTDNLFLKIIEKKIPAQIVYEDEHCLAFRDINPQAPVHVLLVPRKVIRTHDDITAEDQALLGKRAKWVEQAEMDARYREGRCLRCGRDNCRVERCPLAAPIRPGNATRRTQVNVAVPSRPLVTIAAIEEDEDTASPSDEDSD